MAALGTMKAGVGKDRQGRIKPGATVLGSVSLKVLNTEIVMRLKDLFAIRSYAHHQPQVKLLKIHFYNSKDQTKSEQNNDVDVEAGTATVLGDDVNVVLIAGVAGAATVVAVITALVVLLARHCTKEFLILMKVLLGLGGGLVE